MHRPQEDEPRRQRDGHQEEDAEDVAGEAEEDRQRGDEEAEPEQPTVERAPVG